MRQRVLIVVGTLAGLALGFVIGRRTTEQGPVISLDTGRKHRVERVIDGDTIQLENGFKVRYLEINTPEMAWKPGDAAQPGAVEATGANRRLVDGKEVRLALGRRPMDQYGRVLAQVFVEEDGEEINVSLRLLRDGWGVAEPGNMNGIDADEAKRIEVDARKEMRGIWGMKAEKAPAKRTGRR
jgi:micrococcal nuclease